jgi:hypothetical protein
MNNHQKTHSSEHQQVALLLPWYVNKTLQNDEYQFVKNHLKSCLVCKIETSKLEKISAVISQEDLLAPVAHASFLQLKNRIHNKNESTKQKKGIFESLLTFRQWFAKYSSNNLASLYPSIAFTSVLLLTVSLILPAFFTDKQNPTDSFRTLSSSKPVPVGSNEIRLIFSNEAKQNQIMQILASVKGQIVGGPTPQGLFRVRIIKQEADSTNLTEIISLLRKKKLVIFAEPTFSLPLPNDQSPG